MYDQSFKPLYCGEERKQKILEMHYFHDQSPPHPLGVNVGMYKDLSTRVVILYEIYETRVFCLSYRTVSNAVL